MKPLKFTGCVFADDIRHERNGKLLIVGAYAREIQLNAFPAAIGLYLLVQVENVLTGPHNVSLQLSMESIVLAAVDFSATAQTQGPDAIVIGPLVVTLRSGGELRVQAKQGTARYETIGRILVGENAAVTDLPRVLSGGPRSHHVDG